MKNLWQNNEKVLGRMLSFASATVLATKMRFRWFARETVLKGMVVRGFIEATDSSILRVTKTSTRQGSRHAREDFEACAPTVRHQIKNRDWFLDQVVARCHRPAMIRFCIRSSRPGLLLYLLARR